MWNFGLLRRYKIKHFRRPTKLSKAGQFQVVSYGNISGPLFIYLFVGAITIVLLIAEIFVHRIPNINDTRSDKDIRNYFPYLH